MGGRAATLQQLARVAERRGRREEALSHLHEALALQQRAYGEGVPHVNVAAVLSSLDNLALQAGEVDKAAGFLQRALAMRHVIYGNGDHIELAQNLGKMGEVERARRQLPAAAEHFAAQRAMLERLALVRLLSPYQGPASSC